MTATDSSDTWVLSPKPNPQARLRLCCFPHAGGGPPAFQSWPEDLPPEIEILSIQLPGRGGRLSERPYTRLQPLVRAAAQALLPQLGWPFAFFGHSMGALLGFELARHLRRLQRPTPVHVFVSGRRAPQLQAQGAPIHRLPESQFVEALRRINGTPERVLQEPELMRLLLPMLRADFALSETYSYSDEDPLECPLTAFGGVADRLVGEDDLLAWRTHTRSAFHLRMFPGDHFFLESARQPLLTAIAEDLKPYLRRQSGGHSLDNR